MGWCCLCGAQRDKPWIDAAAAIRASPSSTPWLFAYKARRVFRRAEPSWGPNYFSLPCHDTVCGELVAASRTANLAVRKPTAVGLNVTLIVQLALAARLPPQVLLGEAK